MKKIIFITCLLLSVNVFAVDTAETGNVSYFNIHNNPTDNSNAGNRYIIMLDSVSTGNNCGNDQWTGYFDDEVGKAQFSAILAASMAGKGIYLQGTSPDTCAHGALLIRNVYIAW